MTRSEAIAALTDNRARLEAIGVQHAAVFGSHARGDAREDSDIDVLLDLVPMRRTVFDLVAIERAVVEMMAGRTVHVAIADQIKPRLRASVAASAAYAF